MSEVRENKIYQLRVEGVEEAGLSTWYRCPGIEDFVKRVEKEHVIIGVMFEGNNLGFLLGNKEDYVHE